MKHAAHRLLTLLLLIVAMGLGHLCAQTTLYNNDTTYFCGSQTLYHNYVDDHGAFDSWAIITGAADSFLVYLNFFCTDGTDDGTNINYVPMDGYIDIWDGDATTGTRLLHYTGSLYQSPTLYGSGNQITLHVHYNEYFPDSNTNYPQRYLNMGWSFVNNAQSPCGILPNVTVTTTATDAYIHWTPDTVPMDILFDGLTHIVSRGGTLHLSGLTPNTQYSFDAVPHRLRFQHCCQQKVEFYTDPVAHTGCPDVLDLHSDYVRCFYNGNIGVRDFGSDSYESRHTVHTDPNETDFFTGGQLHTVGPGLPGAVRLGNSHSGAEYESIVYYLHVDTILYSLIMLHYAAVLQNPGHDPIMQPRFTMQILDQNNNVIDPQCGAADFVADSTLGWNTFDGLLWKDWTTIGINLAPYHGQDVRLKLTTYDCRAGAHFGYAYFYAECQQPFANSDHCGDIDTTTLTAPAGFNYLWYYGNDIDHPISTTRSATVVTSEGPVRCRLSFIENPSCYLTMNTLVTNFWPHAIVDTLSTQDNGCEGFTVNFLNRSPIVDDDSIPLPGNPPCESAYWFFGDGWSSSDYNPTHTYYRPGTYTVTLIAKLAGGQCTHTTTYTITAPDAWAPADQYLTCCDSLLWIDSLWYSRDTVGPTHRVAYPASCDTIYTLHLSTLPSAHFYLPADTFCYNSTYEWHGYSAPINHTITDTLLLFLNDTLTAANGCDSLVQLPLFQLPPDPLTINVEADCGRGFCLLSAGTEKTLWQWSSSPHDTLLDGHEHDPQILVIPDSNIVYTLTTYYDDSLFCPTTISRTLTPPEFPQAVLEVKPDILPLDQPTLSAYDLSADYTDRLWTVVTHHFTHDTVVLPDRQRHLEYTADGDADSVTVILIVSNDLCLDTASHTLPILQTALFAPNVFTPGIETNNRFFILCEGALEAELTLYNRQGLLVYTTTEIETGWDGTHNETPCPQGAYVWHLRLRSIDRPDDWRTFIGTVTLLR